MAAAGLGALLAALLALSACGQQAAEAPPRALPAKPRLVSINPCVDAILMEVADPDQIAAISHYSQQARASSIPLELAGKFQATSGTAEEVVALSPDLVIAGSHVAPSTIAALHRLGIPLVQIGVPASIAESRAQIRTISAAVGHRARGEVLIGRIEAALDTARTDKAPVPALIWLGGGLVPGTATLADDLLRVTGYQNSSARYGLQSWDVLPLEPLVARPPRLLLSVGRSDSPDRMLSHPVLDDLREQIAVRPFPERLLHCGGPTIIEAVRHLAALRRTL